MSTNLPIARRTSPGCCRRHACRAAADSIVVEMLSPRSQEPGPYFNARAQGREAAKQITDDKFSIPNSQYPCAIHRTCPFPIKSFLLRYLLLLLFKVLAASPTAPLLLGALALSTATLVFPGPNLQLSWVEQTRTVSVVSKPGQLLYYRVLREEYPQAQSLRRPERSEGRRKDWAWGCGGGRLCS